MDVDVYHPLAVDELSYDISIEGPHVLAEMLAHENDLLMEKENLLEKYRHHYSTKKGKEAIFSCAGFVIRAVWS